MSSKNVKAIMFLVNIEIKSPKHNLQTNPNDKLRIKHETNH